MQYEWEALMVIEAIAKLDEGGHGGGDAVVCDSVTNS